MIERYVRRLQDDRGVVVERIRVAVRAETPAYATLLVDTATEQRWGHGIERVLAMFVDGAATGRDLTSEEHALLEAIGRERATQGFPLDAIAASVAVAARVAYDWVLTGKDGRLHDGERAALAELSARLTTFANRITAPLLHAYLARREAA